jgi:hypothetical protein
MKPRVDNLSLYNMFIECNRIYNQIIKKKGCLVSMLCLFKYYILRPPENDHILFEFYALNQAILSWITCFEIEKYL